MSVRDHIGDLVSEKAFYKAVVILLGGLPAVEVITEIIVRFDNRFIPSFFLPQITGLFGIFGTFLTILYWLAAEPGKRKLRPADIFYFTLLFFMIISAVFSRHPGLYSYGDYFYCENPLHFLAYYWLYFAGTLIDDPKYRKNLLYLFAVYAAQLFELKYWNHDTMHIFLNTSHFYRYIFVDISNILFWNQNGAYMPTFGWRHLDQAPYHLKACIWRQRLLLHRTYLPTIPKENPDILFYSNLIHPYQISIAYRYEFYC